MEDNQPETDAQPASENNQPPDEPEYLTCPRHAVATAMTGENPPRLLVTSPAADWTVECPVCGYECQNFLKYPVAAVHNFSTGETYLKNVLTGEIVPPEDAAKYDRYDL